MEEKRPDNPVNSEPSVYMIMVLFIKGRIVEIRRLNEPLNRLRFVLLILVLSINLPLYK
jgi:hypothetical protein